MFQIITYLSALILLGTNSFITNNVLEKVTCIRRLCFYFVPLSLCAILLFSLSSVPSANPLFLDACIYRYHYSIGMRRGQVVVPRIIFFLFLRITISHVGSMLWGLMFHMPPGLIHCVSVARNVARVPNVP